MRTAAQGDGTSDNSEKLLQRGRGEGEASMYVTLVKGYMKARFIILVDSDYLLGILVS